MKRESPEEQRKQMLEAPIPGLIGRLAVPTIISMLVTSIYNMADTYFVSHIGAGDGATSASGAVSIVAGRPPEEDLSPAPSQPSPQSKGSGDALDQLLAFGEKFDNIIIQ